MVKLRNVRNALGSSLWFVPMLIVLCAAALALGLIEADKGVNQGQAELTLKGLRKRNSDKLPKAD